LALPALEAVRAGRNVPVALSVILGYPRIGTRRPLERHTEGYWDGSVTRETLDATLVAPAPELRATVAAVR
jgi:Cobalamin-independent synthase, N-terminal domain